ncbi:4Fe-4S dicluster domain-containing protein [Chloroflexota bacterium]
MTKALLIDTSKCMACRGCQVACKQWWELPAVATTNRGTYENPPDLSAETWNKIRFKEIGSNGTVSWLFTRQACMHCTEAACVKVCPTYARGYHELGFVTLDQERCIGCGRCLMACPFGVPQFGGQDVSNRLAIELGGARTVTYNCLFCADRVEGGLAPSCAKTCPSGAIEFGDRADLITQGKARVDYLKSTYPKAQLYGENELGGLHQMFVLIEEPSVHDLPEQPKVGTLPEFDDKMLPDWYNQAIADNKLPSFPSGARPEWYQRQAQAGRLAPALWGLLGVVVVGGGAALWWLMHRKARLAEGKQKSGKS